MSCLATHWWNPPRVRAIQGVTPHVSNPNIRVTFTAAIYKSPNVLASTPSLPMILKSQAQIIRAFLRFLTTSAQSSLVTVRIHPR